MKKFIKKYKRLMGIILLVLALGFFAFWELIGREELLYSEVIVLKESILKGEEVSESMLEYLKVDQEGIIDACIINFEDIIGLEAKHYIPAGTQLVSNYFDIPSLVLEENEKIMKLPDKWIHSFPETLRRKDKLYIYAVKSKTENSQNSYLNDEISHNNSNSKSKNKEEKTYILTSTAAYVKDNSNKEVNSLDNDRLDASSTISNIEIVVTEEQFEILKIYAQNDFTFILMYAN